jgi:hypothetical protein
MPQLFYVRTPKTGNAKAKPPSLFIENEQVGTGVSTRPQSICSVKYPRKEEDMTTQEATAEVFFTAFKALPKREQQSVLTLVTHDKKLRALLEDISDRFILEEEREKSARPLREYVQDREKQERIKTRTKR